MKPVGLWAYVSATTFTSNNTVMPMTNGKQHLRPKHDVAPTLAMSADCWKIVGRLRQGLRTRGQIRLSEVKLCSEGNGRVPHMAEDPKVVTDARVKLGALLAQLRSAAGHTQGTLAPLTFYGRSSIANIETGRQAAPRSFWQACDRILKTDGALLGEHDRIDELRRIHRLGTIDEQLPHEPNSIAGPSGPGRRISAESPDHLPTGLETLPQLIHELLSSVDVVDDQLVHLFSLAVSDTVERYEVMGPANLIGQATQLRKLLALANPHAANATLDRQMHLMRGQVCGLLAYMAVNLARFAHAETYSYMAVSVAQRYGDHDLAAWARGTQSFAAYYQHDYARAAALAEDGLSYAGTGRQAVRLLVNGLARSLAHLPGRAGDAQAALASAYALADKLDAPGGISPCISLGIYSQGRLAANAVTVYQTLGKPNQAVALIGDINDVVLTSDSAWSRALVALDHASALLQKPRPDIEHAVSLAQRALDGTATLPITSVIQRAQTVLDKVQGSQLDSVAALREQISAARTVTSSAQAGAK